QTAATVDAGELLQQPAHCPVALQPVDQRRKDSATAVEPVDVCHQAMAEWARAVLVVGLKELRLELCRIDVAGTLRLARLAHQAQIVDVVQPALPPAPGAR